MSESAAAPWTPEDMTDHKAAILASVKLAKAVEILARTMPFHAEVMSSWTAQADPGVNTCGVFWKQGALQMRYAPAWFNSISLPEICGVLVHECLHVLFGHAEIVPDESTDLQALLIATETTVNEFVRGFPLPGNPLLVEQFPQLAPLQSTLQRYRLLERHPDERAGGDSADDAGDAARSDATGGAIDDHAGWESIRQGGTVAKLAIGVAKERAARTYGHLLDAATKNALGGAGATIGEHAGQAVERVRSTAHAWLDWRMILGHLPPPRQQTESTLSRPARRRPELVGIVPGRRHVSLPPIVLVAVDVSSSMSATILGWIKQEVRALAGICRVALVEIDVHVQRSLRLFDAMEVNPDLVDDAVHGRGGTSFDAAFSPEVLAWAGDDEEVEAVLFFTDGFGTCQAKPPTVPTVWILADEHDRVRVPASFGMVVGTRGTIVRPG